MTMIKLLSQAADASLNAKVAKEAAILLKIAHEDAVFQIRDMNRERRIVLQKKQQSGGNNGIAF